MSTATMSVDTVRAIDDVEERAREAARIVHTAEQRIDEERRRRDDAAVTIVHREQELPIRVAELAGFSRGLMFRLLDDERLGCLIGDASSGDGSGPGLSVEEATALAAEFDVTRMTKRGRVLDVKRMQRLATDAPKVRSVEDMPNPRDTVAAAAKALRRWESLADRARDVRDPAVGVMLNSPHWRNADVARIIKVTTARVAQMRQGTR